MHRRPVVIFILYFNLICIKTQTVFDVPKSEKNNCNMESAFLHNISIKIFNFLDLEQKYVKLNKSHALLTMFEHQYHIAENLLGTFDEIQNITASNITGNSLKLRNILEDIIREEMHHSRNYNVEKSALNKFDQEFAVFVNIFFDKALKISMKNIINISNRVIKSTILDTSWKRTRDIKVWKPSSVEHFDLFNNTRRIYKGKKAKIKDFPFLVSILINNEFTSAGSIISKDLVITAATGLNVLYKSDKYQELLSTVFVRVGSDYAAKEGSLVSVVDVIFHPGYDPHSLQNNLAILRLVKRLRFSDKRKIQRILFDKKGVFKKNSLVIVLGWGVKDANKEVNLKQKVSVTRLNLFDMDKCATKYSGFYVKDSNFCAGFSDKGGGACNKDTGGPGIVGGELAGVISFGPSVCGQAASPTVFTKIATNVDWITSVINRERSLKIETTTTGRETLTEQQTLPITNIPITNTMPANQQQIPLQVTLQAQPQVPMEIKTQLTPPPVSPQLVSDSLRSLRPLLRLPTHFKLKPKVKLSRFMTVTSDLSNISLPFSTTYFHPTLFSETASLTTEMYPDQTIILKEILKEIILSNTSVIDYILYGSILEDNIEAKYLLSTTQAVDVMHHQLVNKSVFLIEKAEEIMRPVRSKTILSKPILENSNESSSDDEGDISSQIELLNSLYSRPDKSDDINLKDKTESQYNIDHSDTANTESSEKKVSNRFRNTILYENIKNSNDVADDLSSKIREGTKDDIDDYYDNESNGKTTKHYEKQTKTKLSTTSTTEMLKKYENVAFNLNDFDTENRQDKMDQIIVDKYNDENVDDKDIKPQYNKNVLRELRLEPSKMDVIGADQYKEINGGDKKQQYHFQEKQQDEIDQMGRDLFDDDFNKNQEHRNKNFNENPRFKPNQKVQSRDDKYNDKGKQYDKEYFEGKTENKQDDTDQMGKYSSYVDDYYSKRYQNKNYLRETTDYNQNKGGRIEKFTNSAHNYDYVDDFNVPQKTTEKNFIGIGKAAAIPNDEFDYSYKDKMRQNTYKNDRHRLGANDKSDYNQRPMTDEDEKIARYDENFERKTNKRQVYKKSNDDDDFLSILE